MHHGSRDRHHWFQTPPRNAPDFAKLPRFIQPGSHSVMTLTGELLKANHVDLKRFGKGTAAELHHKFYNSRPEAMLGWCFHVFVFCVGPVSVWKPFPLHNISGFVRRVELFWYVVRAGKHPVAVLRDSNFRGHVFFSFSMWDGPQKDVTLCLRSNPMIMCPYKPECSHSPAYGIYLEVFFL